MVDACACPQVMNALKMECEDNTFDLVWACESGEHMPDKRKYIEEMTRVLKPGGTLVIACWCQREETPDHPLSETDKANLQFLYDEWAHPYFISIQEFCRLMQVCAVVVYSCDVGASKFDSHKHCQQTLQAFNGYSPDEKQCMAVYSNVASINLLDCAGQCTVHDKPNVL